MTYEVTINDAAAQRIAAVTDRVNRGNVSGKIVGRLSEVWAAVRAVGVPTGRNVVVYHERPDTCLFRTDEGVPAEMGVEIEGEWPAVGAVIQSETPSGRTASAVHWGDYADLPSAHQAVREWCAANGHALAGPNWEVYGHWSDIPEEVRTDVFYVLA